MPMFYRFWAPVAADTYREPRLISSMEAKQQHVCSAGRALRARLESGGSPPVILIAPERALTVDVTPDVEARRSGILPPSHAFTDSPAGREAARDYDAMTGGRLIFSTLEAPRCSRDPFVPYAERGSVVVYNARMVSVRVPHWLGPAAQQLADWYGVEVTVARNPGLEPADIRSGDPLVFRQALTPAQVADCVDGFYATKDANPIQHTTGTDPRAHLKEATDAPSSVHAQTVSLAEQAAAALTAVPFNTLESRLVRYLPGADHPWHTDISDRICGSLDRTLSFSLLLNEPGRDFTGGDFETKGGVVDLHRGDMVAFTARTLHRVTRVETGERLVLLSFADWHR